MDKNESQYLKTEKEYTCAIKGGLRNEKTQETLKLQERGFSNKLKKRLF